MTIIFLILYYLVNAFLLLNINIFYFSTVYLYNLNLYLKISSVKFYSFFFKLIKFYFYIFIFISLLILLLYYNNTIYLDYPNYNVLVKIQFKGITYNVSGLILNELFYDKGGYFCFTLACHIIYAIALNDQLWNTTFKSDFVIFKPLPYASTLNGSITTDVLNDSSVNVLIENFSIKYEPAITPGNGARRRFLRTLKQLVGNPNLQEFYYSGSGSEPGSVVIEGILSKNNYNIPNIENLTISDFLWDRLQYKDSITEFTNINNSSSNMDLVLHSSLENSAISLFNVKFYFVVLLLMFIYKLYCLNKMIFIKIYKFYLDNSSIYTGIVLLSKNIIYIFNYLLNTFIRELVLLYM